MTVHAIPLADARALTGAALRTTFVRIGLMLALVGLVVAAALAAHHVGTRQTFLPAHTSGVIVLDLSSSISQDTYARIEGTLQQLVSSGGRYGLVIFSDIAYEALPPGTPAAALRPMLRFFITPRSPSHTFTASLLPVNPWTTTFSAGTRISSGLDLARAVLARSGTRHGSVLLISDLADNQSDTSRLAAAILRFRQDRIPIRVVALNPAVADARYFQQLLGRAHDVHAAGLPTGTPGSAQTASPPFPATLVVLCALVALALALSEWWGADLDWGWSR